MMGEGMLAMLLQSLAALAFVLGIFALMIWGMRRFQGFSGSTIRRDFKIVQRIHIDNKHSIVEIRHDNRHYLLGLSPGGMVQLRSDHALPATTTDSPANSTPKESTLEDRAS